MQVCENTRRGHRARRSWTLSASRLALCAVLAGLPGAALADFDVNANNSYKSSALGSNTVNFKGGTLQMDSGNALSNNFTVQDYANNTLDANGHSVTLSGTFTGAGALTFTDSTGGGVVTLTNSANSYTGATTINSGAALALSGTGILSASSSVTANGTFDISQTSAGASIVSLSGGGNVTLGAQTLTLSGATSTFTGTIGGTGGLTLALGSQTLSGTNSYTGITTITSGTLTLGAGGATGSIAGDVVTAGVLAFNRIDSFTFGNLVSGSGGLSQTGTGTVIISGANTYTGATTIAAGILSLSGSGSIANSSGVAVNGTFDISATNGASIKSLSGAGTVQLGTQTLTLTAANGTFSGNITGSGSLVLNGGTQLITGTNSYTGSTIVNAGVLQIGVGTYNNAVTVNNNGILAFNSAGSVTMGGVVSGTGGLSQLGAGITTITTAQAYTGTTTITAGTLALAGNGSIALSGGLVNNGTFSIAGVTGATSISSLSGNGTVQLGSQTLVITSAAGNFTGNISGAGSMTLSGGNQTLSGTNSYTGITTIAYGTLFLAGSSSLASSSKVVNNAVLDVSLVTDASGLTSTSIVSLAGNGSVVLGSKTLTLTNAGDSFSGTISGAGGLTLAGGTQTLTGQNVYGGATTISSGTLALAGAGSLSTTGRVVDNAIFDISGIAGSSTSIGSLSGNGSVNLGAKTLNFTSATDTFSGVILGSGGLTVSGGTQILAGNNTYTGGTVIAAGTLQIGRGLASGSITGDVVNNGTLTFSRSDTYVFSGTVSGSGKLVQNGDGTTVLTGSNLYSGGTTITTGTLQIGNGGASGSLLGDIINNGTLAFGRSDTVSFDGTISGVGGVTQVSGTTILTAVNSYTGATSIAAGSTLVLGANGSIAASSGVTADGVFDVSARNAPRIASLSGSGSVALGGQSLVLTAASGSFSGVIAGTGGLTLNGGTQTLSGVNNYRGATTVNGGTLMVNGSIVSSSGVTVNSGGTLSGTGTVSGVTVANGGTLAPGVSGAGTLHVNGAVTFSNNSTFAVNMTSTSASKLAVTGAQTLAGTLTAANDNGTWLLGQKVTVLSADGGVTGTFALTPISTTGAQFAQTLSYDANNVYLQIDLAKLSPLLPATGVTANQTNAVAGIDAAIAAGNTVPVSLQNLANLTSDELAAGAAQLAGEIGSDLPQAGDALFLPFMDSVFNHMRDAGLGRSKQLRNVWVAAFTGSGTMSGDADTGAQKLRSNATGFAAGADWMVAPKLTLGGAVSVGTSGLRLADGLSWGHSKALQGSLYGNYQFRPRVYGSFAAIAGQYDITTSRTIAVSGTDVLTAKPKANMFGARYETGIMLGWITPYLALQDRLFQVSGYSETARSGTSSFALDYASRSVNMAGAELGVRQSDDIALNRNWVLTVSDRLAWSHTFLGRWSTEAAYAGLADSDFKVQGAGPGPDAAQLSLGAALRNRLGFALNLNLNGNIGTRSQNYTGMIGANVSW